MHFFDNYSNTTKSQSDFIQLLWLRRLEIGKVTHTLTERKQNGERLKSMDNLTRRLLAEIVIFSKQNTN